MLQISTTNHVILDGKDSGLGVRQDQDGTKVYRRCVLSARGAVAVPYQEFRLPKNRYQLAGGKPNDGVGSIKEFEDDVRKYCIH